MSKVLTVALHEGNVGLNDEVMGHLFDRGELIAQGEFVFEPNEDRDVEIKRRGYKRVSEWRPYDDGTSVAKVVKL